MKKSSKNHPVYLRIRARLETIDNRPRLDDLGAICEFLKDRGCLWHQPEGTPWKAREFSGEEREFKRANNQKSFLAELKKRANTPPKEALQVSEWLCWRQAFARACKVKVKPHLSLGVALIPVNFADAELCGFKGVRIGKDAAAKSVYSKSDHDRASGSTKWRNGKPRRYTRATNTSYVQSYGVASRSGKSLTFVFNGTWRKIKAPLDCLWGTDANGIRLFLADSRQDDYHPQAYQLRQNSTDDIRNWILSNRESRRRIEAQEAIEAAELESVWVCLADSIRAGNCKAGTLEFGKRHDLEPTKHYRPSELLAIANGDASRVRLAVKAAVLRHRRETETGLCELSEHLYKGD